MKWRQFAVPFLLAAAITLALFYGMQWLVSPATGELDDEITVAIEFVSVKEETNRWWEHAPLGELGAVHEATWETDHGGYLSIRRVGAWNAKIIPTSRPSSSTQGVPGMGRATGPEMAMTESSTMKRLPPMRKAPERP